MKKTVSLLFFLMAIAFRGFTQDTISGLVSRVDAPFFEQNVCDSRFAITTEGETYYVMVDNYWPNPYLEDLIIHYDTIPVGNEIEVVGAILEMENENGEAFRVIDIQQLVNATYIFGTGYIDWVFNFATISCNIPPSYACYIAINGELQSEQPIVFNGMALDGGPYTLIGVAEIWPDFNLPVLELTQAIPYTIKTTATGIVMPNDNLCLFTPCNETTYLSWSDNDGTHFLTNKDKLHNEEFYSAIWGENVISTIKGFDNTHYNLFGASFKTFETIAIETTGERAIQGQISAVTNPSTGLPISLGIAIRQGGNTYYIENLDFYEYGINSIFNDDTIQMDSEVTATFYSASLFLGRWLTPYFTIHVDEISDYSSIDDVVVTDFRINRNLSNNIIEIISEQPIEKISACDYSGRSLISKTCNSYQSFLDLNGFKGLAIIHVVFANGQTVSRKVVVQ